MREKKSEFMGQFRITVEEKAKIREMLRFYQRDRGTMAHAVMEALFYHHAHKDQLVFPLRFVAGHKVEDVSTSNGQGTTPADLGAPGPRLHRDAEKIPPP